MNFSFPNPCYIPLQSHFLLSPRHSIVCTIPYLEGEHSRSDDDITLVVDYLLWFWPWFAFGRSYPWPSRGPTVVSFLAYSQYE
jgi:hypothetical protein